MKTQTAVIIIATIIVIGLVGVVSFDLTQNTYAIKQGSCPNMNFLWNHTYGAAKYRWSGTQNHSRLTELTPACVVFTGNVTGPPQDTEHDGDAHFNVTPDNTKDNYDLLNQYNFDRSGKKVLVVEIICWYPPDYTKYDKFPHSDPRFCDGVKSREHIPAAFGLKKGDHIHVTGKWVQDIGYPAPDHPKWNEIHPVQSIEKK